MEKFQKIILRTNKIHASTQVDEGELFWKPENILAKTVVDGKFNETFKFQAPTATINMNDNMI